MEPLDAAADVHALIRDVLPALAPSAWFDPGTSEVVLPVGRSEARASSWTVLERCAREPRSVARFAARKRWSATITSW